jgi:selenide,water dikinase
LSSATNAVSAPDLLVGLSVADDAAVYRVAVDRAIVQTVDFFAPVLDDPYQFGAVAAVNAMSDVYAMGGEVLFALNVAAFPESLDPAVVADIFRGGADKVREAGGIIAGGHSIYDPEPKYGLVVTGTLHPDHILTKAGARPGDVLYLTKPLGTGVLCSSLKSGRVSEGDMQRAVEAMLTLNRDASRAAREAGAHALTDVTGFGLLGHADEVGRASGVRLVIRAGTVPAFDGALEAIRDGVRTGGSNRNEEYVHERVQVDPAVGRDRMELLYDPQTSGGLLAAIRGDASETFEDACGRLGVTCRQIGEVRAGQGIEVTP